MSRYCDLNHIKYIISNVLHFFLQNPLTIKKLYVFLHRLDRPGPRTLLYYALGG